MATRTLPIIESAFTVLLSFECEPAQSEDFARRLSEFVAERMRRHAGFLSALIYLSDDARRVVEHFQWARAEDWVAYRQSEDGREAVAWLGRRVPQVNYLELVEAVVGPG
jgi:hypothetical protein